jgi:putative transposase
MRLSPAGQMAHETWQDLVALHPSVVIDTDVVLPEHIHAIVVLEDNPARKLALPDVVHRYKSLTTKRYARAVGERGWPRFAGKLWQESFYDHGIRGDDELEEIRRYIAGNVERYELRRVQVEGARGG